LAARATETYVLASAEKLGAASPYRVLPLADVTGIVTDAKRNDPTVRRLTRAGVRVLT
jgi:DeoR/GlpR family transcriptional regulator of sugar metabolism